LVEPGLTATFRWRQKRVQLEPPRRVDILNEQTPQTRFHPGTDFGDKSLQNADTRKKHFMADQPTTGVVEQQAGPIRSGPAQSHRPSRN
jgi:hypothetical protein